MNKTWYIILSNRNFDSFKESTTKIFLGKKILPSVSLLVSYIMKKSNEAGKVKKFSKKAVSLKLYKTKYILLSYTKFNYFEKIRTKIFLSKKNSLAIHFLIFYLTKKDCRSSK